MLIYGWPIYRMLIYRKANLQNADLWDTNLQNADLREANLQNADLYGAPIYKMLIYGPGQFTKC